MPGDDQGEWLDLESYWKDVRPKQLVFRWSLKVEPVRDGISLLAEQLGVEREVLCPDPEGANGSRTISAWFRGSGAGQSADLVSQDGRFSLRLVAGSIEFEREQERVVTPPLFDDGQWHQVMVVADRDIYVDGVLIDAEVSVNPSGPPPPRPGDDAAISDVALWDRELTHDELMAVYNEGDAPNIASDEDLSDGLVGWWRVPSEDVLEPEDEG